MQQEYRIAGENRGFWRRKATVYTAQAYCDVNERIYFKLQYQGRVLEGWYYERMLNEYKDLHHWDGQTVQHRQIPEDEIGPAERRDGGYGFLGRDAFE